jgi:hypothetical protein
MNAATVYKSTTTPGLSFDGNKTKMLLNDVVFQQRDVIQFDQRQVPDDSDKYDYKYPETITVNVRMDPLDTHIRTSSKYTNERLLVDNVWKKRNGLLRVFRYINTHLRPFEIVIPLDKDPWYINLVPLHTGKLRNGVYPFAKSLVRPTHRACCKEMLLSGEPFTLSFTMLGNSKTYVVSSCNWISPRSVNAQALKPSERTSQARASQVRASQVRASQVLNHPERISQAQAQERTENAQIKKKSAMYTRVDKMIRFLESRGLLDIVAHARALLESNENDAYIIVIPHFLFHAFDNMRGLRAALKSYKQMSLVTARKYADIDFNGPRAKSLGLDLTRVLKDDVIRRVLADEGVDVIEVVSNGARKSVSRR